MNTPSNSIEPKLFGLYNFLLLIWLIATMGLWALAFFHLPDSTPEWVLRAQSVCFGTNETGLPDTSGWMVLVLSPISFLVIIFVALRDLILLDLKNMFASPIGKVLLFTIGVLVLGQAAWVATRIAEGIEISNTDYTYETSETLPEGYPQTSLDAAPFNLVNQNGDKVNLDSLKGNVVFVTFAFAHCKTICPSIVKSVNDVQGELLSLPVKSAIITLDPWRDTPSSISGQAKRWKLTEKSYFLTGDVEEVKTVLDGYNVARARDEKTGDVTHPALVYVLDQNSKIAYTFNNPYPSWLKEAAHRLISNKG